MRVPLLVASVAFAGVLLSTTSCQSLTGDQPATGDQPGSTSPPSGSNSPKLVVLERSASTLKLQWDAFGASNWYSVDVMTGQTSCPSLPAHMTGTKLSATTFTLTGLTPSTRYHIHIHTLESPNGLVGAGTATSQFALVNTLSAGSAVTAAVASDYEVCP
jgi:hypothetical protein